MANLLERASVVLTPTAYNNGEALCIKPDDASGDFQFSRNSAATRVNAQGLVENVQILSSNLVQNGDFSEEGVEEVSNGSFSQEGSELVIGGDFSNPSDWNLGGINLSISNGKGISTGSNFGAQFKQTILTINKTYKLVFDIVDYTSGAIGLTANYYGVAQTFNSVGTHTAYFTSLNQTELRLYSENFIGSIDNVSVREVGQDWILGGSGLNTPTIGSNSATITSVDSNSYIQQNSVLTSGKSYKISYEILSSSGSSVLKMVSSLGLATVPTTVGTHTVYGTAITTTFYIERTSNGMNATITNISVKEVGQNWTLGTGWSIGEDKAVFDGGSDSNLSSAFSVTNGKSYKYSFTVSDMNNGALSFRLGSSSSNDLRVTSNGSYSGQAVSDGTVIRFRAESGFNGSVTNISVIEITNDTNLPRISYENFSYQDALGSELVTNGSFDTDSDWTKQVGWSIENSKANALNSSQAIYQVVSFNSQKQYKISYTISNYVSGDLRFVWGNVIGATNNGNGTYTQIVSPTSGGLVFYLAAINSFTGSIDNVSVKEYLGQEVVPNSGCGSWLWEPQSTNLITYSEDFSNASWIKAGASVTSNAVISPEGILNADKLVEDSTNGHHILDTGLIGSKSGSYTYSLFAKKGENNFLVLWWVYASTSKTWFDLENGVVGSQTGTATDNAKIEDYGNGWFKCSVTRNEIGNVYCVIGNSNQDAVFSYQGDGTSGIYIWGAQLEQQSYATSYIPTSGSTVTRNQDVCTNGGSLANINSTEGVLYAEIATLANDSSERFLSISDGTSANRISLWYYSAANGLAVAVYSGNSAQFFTTTVLANDTDFNKIAISYAENDFALWINGIEISTDTSGITPIGLSELSFDRGDGNLPFFGKTKALAVFPYLTDQELTELTTI